MTVGITLLSPALGAEIHGIDLTRPIADADFEQVRNAFLAHGVIVLRGQAFDDHDHIRFSARFGELKILKSEDLMLKGHPEILVVSNVVENGRYIGSHDAGMFWHSDGPFLTRPHGPSALHAYEVPTKEGRALGDTEFTSTAAAYDALPGTMKKRLEGLFAVHSLLRRSEKAAKKGIENSSTLRQSPEQETRAVHPVVRPHPTTGRKCLYVSDGYTTRIMGIPENESTELIHELTTHLIKPEFRYVHSWCPHDLVMWDNCSTQHKATFDYKLPQRRRMHRTTLVG